MRKRGKPNVDLIIREYNKGFNAEQIAAMDWCEVKAPTVLNILKRNGIKIRQTKEYSDARRELMVEDYKSGMTVQEIADKHNVVVECVRVNLSKVEDESFAKRYKLMNTLFPGGRTAGKRGTESYIRKSGLWDEFVEFTNGYVDNPTLKDRILILKYGDVNRCKVCGAHISQEATYCYEHRFEGRKGKPAHNRSVQDEQRIVEAYESGMSSLEISNQDWCSCSHVTVMNILKRNGVELLSQSEILLRKREEIPEQEIIEYYKTSNIFRTARVFNVPVYRVRELVEGNKLSHSEACQHNFPDYTEESKEWNEQYLSGKRVKDIAEENNLSYSTVAKYIKPQPRDKLTGKQLCGRKVDFSGLEELYKTITLSEIARHYNCNEWTVRGELHALGITKPKDTFTQPERAISLILNKYNIEHEIHNRSIIAPKELDIWIPSHNIAIEVNGLYWHSTQVPKVDRRHIDKFNHCMNVGIKLIQFTDADVVNKPELIESMILSKLGLLPNRIMARKCSITEIGIKQANQFYSKWHYQGQTTNAAKSLALIHDNEVVALLSYTTKGDITRIERYACKPFTNIVGGYSKLEKRVPGNTLVTFSLGLISDGSVYRKNGYETEGYATKPEFYITDGFELMNRQRFMKHKMPALFGAGFDPNKTEWENVIANGLMLFFGAGITKWVKER